MDKIIIDTSNLQNEDYLPKLSEEQNQQIFEYISKLQKRGLTDLAEFREKIFIGNLYLVTNLANKYSQNQQQFEELFQEGSIALFKAIINYNFPNKNTFQSYAHNKINKAMQATIPNLSSVIKFPVNFNSDLRTIKRMQAKKERDKSLNMSKNFIEKHINRVTTTSLEALENALLDNYLDSYIDKIDLIDHLVWAFKHKLTKLEELIIRLNFGIQDRENPEELYEKPRNISSISTMLKISPPEVTAIRNSALKKIKMAIRSTNNLRTLKNANGTYLEFWPFFNNKYSVQEVLEKIGILSAEEQEKLFASFGYNLKKKCYDQDDFALIKDIIDHLEELLNPQTNIDKNGKYLKDYLGATDDEVAYLYKSSNKDSLCHQLFEIIYGEGYLESEMGVDKLDFFSKQRRTRTISNFRKKLQVYRENMHLESKEDIEKVRDLIAKNPNSQEFIEAIPLKYQFITELRLGLYDGHIYSLYELSKIFGLNNAEVLKQTKIGIKYFYRILNIYQNLYNFIDDSSRKM